jgi:hypothetical protein
MHAIGQTSTDHQPYVQENHGEKLLTALIKCMDDPVARCQSHACAAFVNLGEELPQETMLAFTEPLMTKLGQLAQHQSRYVVEQAITCIAVVAGCIEEHFVPFYPHIIPYMKTMIVQKTAKEERNLRGKCFECMSLVGLGVGKDVFQADAVELMTAMIATLEGEMDADDPQKSFIEEAISRVCRTMKKDFAPFLPKLLDMSLKVLSVKPEFTVNPDDDDDDDDQTLTFLGDGTCVGLKTSQINDLQTHLNMVYVFVEVLGPVFFDYVQPTANVLKDMLDFPFDTEIREVAISTWSEMMKCTKEGLEQRGSADLSMVSEMLRALIAKLGKVLEEEEDTYQLQTLAGGMAEAIKAAHANALAAKDVDDVCALSMKLLQESFERRAEANKEVQKVEDDDDEKEEWEMQKQADEQVRLKVAEIAGAVMKTHPDLFMQSGLERYATALPTLLSQKEDVILGIYIACDMLMYLGERAVTVWPVFIPKLLEGLQAKDEELRQACAYGVASGAPYASFAQYAPTAYAHVVAALQDPKAQKKKNKSATENLAAALGNLCQHQIAVLPAAADGSGWQLWLGHLPVTVDTEEGVKVHKQLATLLAQQHPLLLGASGERLSLCVKVLVEVYKGTSADDEVNGMIRQIVSGLQGQGTLQGLGLQKLEKKIARVLRDASKQ